MPKLTDTQLLILSGAAQRDDRVVETAPTLKPASKSAANQLLNRGLLSEVAAAGEMPVWRHDEALGAFALIITPAGLQAIGVIPEEIQSEEMAAPADAAPAEAPTAPPVAPGRKRHAGKSALTPARSEGGTQEPTNAPRDGSKLSTVIALLQRDGGVSIAELTKTTGWLPHTARAALTGLRKRGYTVGMVRNDGTTVYRIVSPAPQTSRRSRSKAVDQA